MIQPGTLRPNDAIGLAAVSHVADPMRYAAVIRHMENMGYRVKIGANFYKDTYGYLASEEERAVDFNALIRDPDVKMIFFGGGEGAAEILPLLDYDAIKANPKIIASYSDGTSILNAITAKTGLVTFYGQSPSYLPGAPDYFMTHFNAHIVNGDAVDFVKSSEWKICHAGVCEGELIGGYARNFALMLHTEYLHWQAGQTYILFIEDCEDFSDISCVSMYLSHIEQNAPMTQIGGLLFGYYADEAKPDLLARLARFGAKHNVPVVYCDDFGHGMNHGILPIGRKARLDADKQTLAYL